MLGWLQGKVACLISPPFTAVSLHTLFQSCAASLQSMLALHGQTQASDPLVAHSKLKIGVQVWVVLAGVLRITLQWWMHWS